MVISTLNSTTTTTPLGINLKSLIPYNVFIISSKISDGKLLKQFLQSDMFNILDNQINTEIGIQEFINKQVIVDIVCVSQETNKESLEIIKTIKEIKNNVIIVLFSHHITKEMIREVQSQGVNSLIIKPFSRSQLYEKFAGILGRTDLISKKILLSVNNVEIDPNKISIPPIPSVMMDILNFNENDPNVGSIQIERIINPDKALTLDIIKIANSAFYGRSGSINNLKDAITLLGMKTIKNLVILQSKKKFMVSFAGEIFDRHLTKLPILSSLIAQDLIFPFGLQKLQSGLFTNCMLRKIGMIILAQNFPKKYQRVLERLEDGIYDLYSIEKEEIHLDSKEISVKVFKHWKFPKNLQDMILSQNFPLEAIATVNDIDRVALLAEILGKRLMGIPTTDFEQKMEMELFEFYKASEKVRGAFNEFYFETIKEHPYFN
jgi:HD-like signal output (HDOD) protein